MTLPKKKEESYSNWRKVLNTLFPGEMGARRFRQLQLLEVDVEGIRKRQEGEKSRQNLFMGEQKRLNINLLNAVVNGNVETAKCLIEKGAEVNAKDNDGWTPLIMAARSGHIETAKFFVDNGAEVNAKDNDGWTSLIWAVWFGHTETAKLLIENGAEVNAKDNFGRTPLIWAASNGHTEAAKCLIEKGADPNIKLNNGKSALDLADNDKIKRLLKEAMETSKKK